LLLQVLLPVGAEGGRSSSTREYKERTQTQLHS